MINTLSDKLTYFRNPVFRKRTRYTPNRNPFTGENVLSIEIANYLKAQTIKGNLRGVWTKIAHETSSKSFDYGILMRNMGKNPGAADFIFVTDKSHLWLELKIAKSAKASPSQIFFKNWCEEQLCNYFIVKSLNEAIAVLTEHGIISAVPMP